MCNDLSGYIFNIQKFSLHDGPGIRTTIFFKGCNLQCRWCANPESQRMEAQLTLDRGKCSGCGRCIAACDSGARKMQEGFPAVEAASCRVCGSCLQSCPSSAIAVEGRRISVQEALEEALKDLPFYQQSGGGVTFSGGEVLLQQEFATALARELHRHGVHVAIETAAAVEPERFRAFLQEVDYVFIDLKHYDCARHIAGTGVSNAQIIENLRTLHASGRACTVRIPVIPGYNDSLADAAGFAQLLGSLGIAQAQLLPFHQLGERKYELLGRKYAFAGQAQYHAEDLQNYQQTMRQHGLDARF